MALAFALALPTHWQAGHAVTHVSLKVRGNSAELLAMKRGRRREKTLPSESVMFTTWRLQHAQRAAHRNS